MLRSGYLDDLDLNLNLETEKSEAGSLLTNLKSVFKPKKWSDSAVQLSWLNQEQARGTVVLFGGLAYKSVK